MPHQRLPIIPLLSRCSGFALVVVIVVLLFVSFLASQLILQVRTEQQVAFNAISRGSSRYLAEAGIQLALFRLLDKPLEHIDEEHDTMLQGIEYGTALETGTIRYIALSEAGKIDLNKAPPGLLTLLFAYHGLTAEESAVIIDSLQDWRDPDDLLRLNGAEKETYQALSPPYIPRNGAIEEPVEFPLVNGTAKLAGKFEPEEVFTVHNPQGKINCNSLSPAMLAFLAEGDTDRMQAFREAQKIYLTLNSAMVRQLLGDDRFAEVGQYLAYEPPGPTAFYSITATGRPHPTQAGGPAPPGVKASALVRIFGDAYQILAWRERGA